MTGRGGRDSQRAFGYALLVSLAAHSLFMFALPSLRAGAAKMARPTPLLARLVHEQPRPPAAPPATAQRPAAPPPPPQVEAAPTPPRETIPAEVAPAAALVPAPAPAPVTQNVPPAAPVVQAAPVAPAARQAEPRSPSGTAFAEMKTTAVAAAPAGLDPALVSQYRIAVMGTAHRYKRYPRIAMENNWQGRVEVTMKLRANGSIAALDVKKSTGYEALDRQALDMIREANSRTPLPETLRGREFAIDIPVVFSLRDPST